MGDVPLRVFLYKVLGGPSTTMSKRQQNQDRSSTNLGNTNLGNRLFQALTQQEIAQLIEALFAVLSPELQEQAMAQLSADTQKTIQQILAPQILASPSESQESEVQEQGIAQPSDPQPSVQQSLTVPPLALAAESAQMRGISLAKQAQLWSELWGEWDAIAWAASEEDGKYLVQEHHWEPPYFDATTFMDDLEDIARQMLPLLQAAFEHQFSANRNFVSALMDTESEVAAGIPDWIEITDGLYLEPQLTRCLLQWECLIAQKRGQDAFQLVQHLRQSELGFQEVEFDSDALLNFLAQLSDTDRRCILTGLTANKETSLWQRTLNKTSSHWHLLYLNLTEQYAPERYLDKLRLTIVQHWQNGLPVIEALLAAQDYDGSLGAIAETLHSLLKSQRQDTTWTPETSLLVATLTLFSTHESDVSQLLGYYQQTAQGLNQTERAHALEIQQLAISQRFNWSAFLQALAEIPVSPSTRHALFLSWRDRIDRTTKPRFSGSYSYTTTQSGNSWWVPWLIDSVFDPQKGATWFQQQISQWIATLPGDKTDLGENYDLLRLLTKDLTEIHTPDRPDFPQFYQVVIEPQRFSGQDAPSRQAYLQQYAPADLFEQVMHYWQNHLHAFIPPPESAHKSEYSQQVLWMASLRELCPDDYKTLLDRWWVRHKRRSNLWKAMKQAGLS